MPPLYLLSGLVYYCLFNSPMALHSSLVMFCLGVFAFFKMVLILPLSSSATPCSSFWHTFSTSIMQSTRGGSLSTIAKFGPQAKSLSCTVDKGLLEMLMTHLALDVFSTVSPAVSCSFDACLPMPPYCWVWAATSIFLAQSIELAYLS